MSTGQEFRAKAGLGRFLPLGFLFRRQVAGPSGNLKSQTVANLEQLAPRIDDAVQIPLVARVLFEDLANILKLHKQLEFAACGRMKTNTDIHVLQGDEAQAVVEVFEDFFNPERWDDPKAMHAAWKNIPNAVKKIEMQGETVKTPASIYKNAQGLLAYQLIQPTAEIISLAEHRVA